MRQKYYLVIIPVILITVIFHFVNQTRNDMTNEFNSNKKFSYTREDYDQQNYVIFDTFNYLHNDLEHHIIQTFYQEVNQNKESVYNHVFYNRANTRMIQNAYFDGEQILVNEYEVSYVGDVLDTRSYTCGSQIVLVETDDSIRYRLVDCQLDYSAIELEESENPNEVTLYLVPSNLDSLVDPF